MSVTSRVSFATCSDWRVLSILRPCSSGCVYCAYQFVLNVGLYSVTVLVVVCLLLFSVTT